MVIRFGILTVSDRSFHSQRDDLAGPALYSRVMAAGNSIVHTAIVPDEIAEISSRLIEWSEADDTDVLLTTGGTGFSPRDVTPEATLAVIQRLAPGIAEASRAFSLKITPHAMLSRNVAGIRKRTLIINLPGSPKGAVEILDFLLPVLSHAAELLRNSPTAEAGHQKTDH